MLNYAGSLASKQAYMPTFRGACAPTRTIAELLRLVALCDLKIIACYDVCQIL